MKKFKRRNNRENRNRVDLIQRRIDYLDGRLGTKREDDDARVAYDRAEVGALRWALGIVKDWIASDPIQVIRWGGTTFVKEAPFGEIEELEGRVARDGDARYEILEAFKLESDGDPVIKLTVKKLPRADSEDDVQLSLTNGEVERNAASD